MEGVPEVTRNIVRACGSVDLAVQALRADDSENAQAFIEKWDYTSESDRTRLKLEEIFTAAGLTAREFIEVLTGALMQQCQDVTKMMVAVAQPKVIQATIDAAVERVPITDRDGDVVGYSNGDVKAMELFHKATGFLPTPKGSSTTINLQQLNQTANVNSEEESPAELQSMDEFLIEIQDCVRPQLPAPQEHIPVLVQTPDVEYLDADV